jgi:hypothetical protein
MRQVNGYTIDTGGDATTSRRDGGRAGGRCCFTHDEGQVGCGGEPHPLPPLPRGEGPLGERSGDREQTRLYLYLYLCLWLPSPVGEGPGVRSCPKRHDLSPGTLVPDKT